MRDLGEPTVLNEPSNATDAPDKASTAEKRSAQPGVIALDGSRRFSAWPLVPPLFLAMLALLVLGHRIRTSDWLGLLHREPARSGTPQGASRESDQRHTAEPLETVHARVSMSVAENDSQPTAPTSEATPPLDSTVSVRVQSPSVMGLPGESQTESSGKPAFSANTSKPEMREAVATQAWREIEQAATRERESRDQLASLKPVLRQVARAESEERSIQTRAQFLKQVREVMSRGRDAANDLEKLSPENAVSGGLLAFPELREMALSRELRRAWVLKLRNQGVEESRILAAMADALLHNRAQRDAPRDRTQALWRSATELLAIPLDARPVAETTPRVELPARPNLADRYESDADSPRMRSRRRH